MRILIAKLPAAFSELRNGLGRHAISGARRSCAVLVAGAWLLLTGGCSDEPKSRDSSEADSRIVVCTGIRPIAFVAAKIGGKFTRVSSLVPEGKSPHGFSPSPVDIGQLQRAGHYFSINLALERNVVIPTLRGTDVKVTDVSKGIERLPMSAGHAHECDDCGAHHHRGADAAAPDHELLDPHIWLEPENIMIIAANILAALSEALPERAEYFKLNYQRLERNLQSLDSRLRKHLAPFKGATFLVYHPAFGYFANRYGLVQESVEIDGKSPSPRRLSQLIETAREKNIRIIFVQPQFNQKAAGVVAAAIQGRVVPLNPLHYNVVENLNTIALEIRQALGRE